LSTSSAHCANSQSSTDSNIIKASVFEIAISECNVECCNDACDVITSNDGNLSILSDFSKLQFIDVRVSDDCNVSCELSALNDGGAEVCLANSSALSALHLVKIGNVLLSGAIGGTFEADLVKLKVSHADMPIGIEIVCAVCETATHPLILNSEVIHKLQKHRALYVSSVTENIDVDNNDDDDVNNNDNTDSHVDDHSGNKSIVERNKGQGQVNDNVPVVQNIDGNNHACKLGIELLIDEQINDESLKGSFSLAKRHKCKLFLKNGILHRMDNISGQHVEQLVLPESRRN
jgi:hypothetical protein